MLHLVHAKALYKRETYRALHRVDYDDCAEHKIEKPEVSQHVDARYAQNSGFLLCALPNGSRCRGPRYTMRFRSPPARKLLRLAALVFVMTARASLVDQAMCGVM